MSTFHRIAFGCYLTAILILTLIGLKYFFSDELMPYHTQAVGIPWQDLPPKFQMLFLAFLHGSGAAMIAISIIIAFVLFLPFREQKRWSEWAIPIAGLMLCLPLFYIVLILRLKTHADNPLGLVTFVNLLFFTGFVITKVPKLITFVARKRGVSSITSASQTTLTT